MSPSELNCGSVAAKLHKPRVTSFADLTIIEAWNSDTETPDYVTFYLVTPEEEVYLGHSTKNKREISFAEYSEALHRLPDEEIYPMVPGGIPLTIAPGTLDDASIFVKRPGLSCYEDVKGTSFIPRSILEETLVMEQISKSPHPNIVGYHGCRVKHGRITAIVLERLDQTLTKYALTRQFDQLDKAEFIETLEMAVDHLHSLGLAHNDINPTNIMIKNDLPVLIDFGSCQPFGSDLQSLGTEGWFKEQFSTSEKKHDTYSLGKLREWLYDPKRGE